MRLEHNAVSSFLGCTFISKTVDNVPFFYLFFYPCTESLKADFLRAGLGREGGCRGGVLEGGVVVVVGGRKYHRTFRKSFLVGANCRHVNLGSSERRRGGEEAFCIRCAGC